MGIHSSVNGTPHTRQKACDAIAPNTNKRHNNDEIGKCHTIRHAVCGCECGPAFVWVRSIDLIRISKNV